MLSENLHSPTYGGQADATLHLSCSQLGMLPPNLSYLSVSACECSIPRVTFRHGCQTQIRFSLECSAEIQLPRRNCSRHDIDTSSTFREHCSQYLRYRSRSGSAAIIQLAALIARQGNFLRRKNYILSRRRRNSELETGGGKRPSKAQSPFGPLCRPL